jgi:predicted TIM-barrel fold metal-dependent hydrolase
MIIDCHYHLDTEMVPLENLLKSMDKHGIDRVTLMSPLTPPLEFGSGAEGVALKFFQWIIHNEKNPLIGLVRQGYKKSVRPGGRVSLGSREYKLYDQPDNDSIMDACKGHPDRFYGWIVINPRGGEDPVSEIERCIKSPGMIGVKVHPYWYDLPISMLLDSAEWCEKNSKPMIIHLGLDEKGDFRMLPEKFPGLRVIYCHAGVPYPNPVCAYARGKENVYVDLSGSAFINPGAARKAVRLAGEDKCLFGTDGPYHHDQGRMFDFGFYKDLIQAIGLSDEAREKVLSRNFLRIIGA